MRVRKAVLPVAGLGTRMLPATKALPKELVPVVDRPAVQRVVESVVAAGVEEVVLVTSAGKSALEDHFDSAPELERALEASGKTELLAAVRRATELARVASVRQHAPLGLGHAVLAARDLIGDEPFAVVLPDELVLGERSPLSQCLEVAERTGGPVIGLVEVGEADVSRYGIVATGAGPPDAPVIVDLVEKPAPEDAPSRLAITGPYVLVPEALDELAALDPGSGGEIQLTDGLRGLAHRMTLHGRLVEGRRLDVGHPLGFVQANVAFALADEVVGPPLRAWLEELLGSTGPA